MVMFDSIHTILKWSYKMSQCFVGSGNCQARRRGNGERNSDCARVCWPSYQWLEICYSCPASEHWTSVVIIFNVVCVFFVNAHFSLTFATNSTQLPNAHVWCWVADIIMIVCAWWYEKLIEIYMNCRTILYVLLNFCLTHQCGPGGCIIAIDGKFRGVKVFGS